MTPEILESAMKRAVMLLGKTSSSYQVLRALTAERRKGNRAWAELHGNRVSVMSIEPKAKHYDAPT